MLLWGLGGLRHPEKIIEMMIMGISWKRKKYISKTEYYNGFIIDGSEFKNLSNSADEQKNNDSAANCDSQNVETEKCKKKECLKGLKIEAVDEKDKYEKIKKAYDTVVRTREFEINLYWDRTKYFWAFITTIYVAYYNVLIKMYAVNKSCEMVEKEVFSHGHLPLLILAGLGFLFSVAWILANKGSRHWQENWEKHMDLLEDYVTGPLHKTFSSNSSYSLATLNLCLSYVVCACAFGLFFYEIVEFCKKLNCSHRLFFYIILILFAAIGIITFMVNTKSYGSEEGEITFDRKILD